MHQICDWTKYLNRHSSKSIWVTRQLDYTYSFWTMPIVISSPVANLMHHSLRVSHVETNDSYALSFYVTKTVLVGPKWFLSDQIDLDLTTMIWSWPKWNGLDQNELVRSKSWFSTKMNHIWTWPIHFGGDHFILVMTKSLWSSPNQFGQTKTILDRPKLFWSHRRTRHSWYFS